MTTDIDAQPQTVGTYPPGTQWTFRTNGISHQKTVELALFPEVNGSAISDEHTPDEIAAQDLWRVWIDEYADHQHKQNPDVYEPGEVRIYWTITTPQVREVFELAPHAVDARAVRSGAYIPPETFATVYTHPAHAVTGEPLNWLRLPVLDRGWNATAAHKGGFIQEATGWKPSPFQPSVDIRQIGAAAGLYVPPL
ncbi:hypothetical protein ACIBI8_37155 [Streptomyces sp. NPDC050529]|uniref:hypothetical protein n=1 Tax=Streptomyces sp. NPDC050529 TaxID=3365624 RepID=UPI0037938663